MNTSGSTTFGACFAAANPADRPALHAAEGDREAFADYDRALGNLFDHAIRGTQILGLTLATRRTESDVIALKLSDEDGAALAAVLAPEAQQARGAWYVPETDKPLVGMVEFARWGNAEPRFSISAADQRAAVKLDTPDAIAVWAALEPVMELLYLPLKLRSGRWLGARGVTQMEKDWAIVDAAYATLGIDTDPLTAFKDGRGWATLSIEQIIAARQALLRAWKEAPPDLGERAIVLLISRLVERYYAKAKDGMAQRTKVVMNKGLERALTGGFGGDWLALVRYLGEQVHPSEQIATAVEPTSLLISARDRVTRAAASTRVPIEDIERVLTAYWGGQVDSPVEQRARIMRDWWRAFDRLHAEQTPGKPSLWGLLGGRFEYTGQNFGDGIYTWQGYRLLPAEINVRIEALWGTAVLPRWPQALVTEPYPQASFADTLGAGIDFWNGVALTCWFICEGPYSRTDIGGMSNYYDRQIKALDDLGCPIDYAMFADLREAEKKLTERPLPAGDTTEYDVGNGLDFSITVSMGPMKKDGYEHLRDIVTRYRRAWAEQYFERYLTGRWEQDLRDVGDAYHRHAADKGKPPTLKQFAKIAAQAANRWFGGDLAQLSNALGLPAPDAPTYHRLLPVDRAAFIARVCECLGGQLWEDSPEEMSGDERQRRGWLSELAERAPEVVQVWEATGEPPPLKGMPRTRWLVKTSFGEDTEAGWQKYLGAVESALNQTPETPRVILDPDADPAQQPMVSSTRTTQPQRTIQVPRRADLLSSSPQPRRPRSLLTVPRRPPGEIFVRRARPRSQTGE